MNTAPKLPQELLARNVRNALGPYNDDDLPLIELIVQLRNKLALAPPSGEGVEAPPAWQNIDNAEAEFLRNLADNGGLAPLVSGMLRHCARLLDRTTTKSALIQRFRQAVRSLAGLKGEKPMVYAEDIETLVEVLRVLEATPQSAPVDGDDTRRLNAIATQRIGLTPEFEGPWYAEVYGEEGHVTASYMGVTPRCAIDAAIRAQPHVQTTAKEFVPIAVFMALRDKNSALAMAAHGYMQELEAVRAERDYLKRRAATTPPPASQERGVRCDAIPKHDWEILSVQPNEYEPDLEGGWKRCRICGTRSHFTRERTPPSSAAEPKEWSLEEIETKRSGYECAHNFVSMPHKPTFDYCTRCGTSRRALDAAEQAKPERLESAAVGLESVGGETVKQARAGGGGCERKFSGL